MSFHVYISYPGFKDQPISAEDWNRSVADVVARDARLEALQPSTSDDECADTTLRFRENKRQRLARDPYGLGHAQDPDMALVEVMFEVADRLGAAVYSERLKPYQNPKDWESRTAQYRARRDEQRGTARKQRIIRRLFWVAVLALGCAIGYWIG